jgi:hypothetical protein
VQQQLGPGSLRTMNTKTMIVVHCGVTLTQGPPIPKAVIVASQAEL